MKSYNILLQNNKHKITVARVEPSVWTELHFDKHHYLSNTLNKSAKCLLFFMNGEPCAFVALLNSPRKGKPHGFSISRIVILPDFQGMGLFKKIIDFCGSIIKACGQDYELYIKTIHTRAGKSLTRNSNWTPTSYNGKVRSKTSYETGKYNHRLTRVSFCYKFSGAPLNGYKELLLPVQDLRSKKVLTLF